MKFSIYIFAIFAVLAIGARAVHAMDAMKIPSTKDVPVAVSPALEPKASVPDVADDAEAIATGEDEEGEPEDDSEGEED